MNWPTAFFGATCVVSITVLIIIVLAVVSTRKQEREKK